MTDEGATAPVGFEAWYREHWPRLVGSLSAFTKDPELAREAAAEACSRAFASWSRVGGMDSPAAWTYRVAINVLRRRSVRLTLERDALRHRRYVSAVTEAEDEPDAAVWAAVRALPPRQRTAIALRYIYDLPQAEIAVAMRIAPGTVAATLSKARAQLSRMLGENESQELEVRGV